MLVACPSCKTTYKVSDELLKGAAPVFRCSRCRHTFELESHTTVEKVAQKPWASEEPPQQNDKAEELSFSFPAQKIEKARELEIDQKTTANFPSTRSTPVSRDPTAGQGTKAPKAPQHDLAISKPPAGLDVKQTIDSPPAVGAISQPQQPTVPPQETTGNVLPLDPHRDQAASVVPFLTLFFLLVVSFGLLTAIHQVHPKTSEGVVKKIPLLGASVLKNNHLKTGVDLQSLRAGYQTIQGNREVFVITGVALNTNPVVIRDVRVAGHLYNHEGTEMEQQTIWIGNAISTKIIRGMTTQDISDLQRLRPLKTFDIPPGDTVPFTIVFVKAPKAKDFTCEVLSAEAET